MQYYSHNNPAISPWNIDNDSHYFTEPGHAASLYHSKTARMPNRQPSGYRLLPSCSNNYKLRIKIREKEWERQRFLAGSKRLKDKLIVDETTKGYGMLQNRQVTNQGNQIRYPSQSELFPSFKSISQDLQRLKLTNSRKQHFVKNCPGKALKYFSKNDHYSPVVPRSSQNLYKIVVSSPKMRIICQTNTAPQSPLSLATSDTPRQTSHATKSIQFHSDYSYQHTHSRTHCSTKSKPLSHQPTLSPHFLDRILSKLN